MARSRELRYEIVGDDRDFRRALNRSNRDLGRNTRSLRSFASVGTGAFSRVGVAAKGAGLAIGAGVVYETARMVKQWRESVKVGRQTEAVLRSTGGAANVNAKQVADLANAISLKVGKDDEEIQSMENVLLTFTKLRNERGKGNKIFDEATKITVDLATAMDQDLNKSAVQVGKALNDPVKGMTALRRVGVTFTEDQIKQVKALEDSGHHLEAQKIILRELKTEFQGSGAAQADAFDKAKVAVENLEEAFGRIIGPPMANFVEDATRKVIPAANRTADAIGKIWKQPGLSTGRKLELSFEVAKANFGPLIKEAQDQLEKANLGGHLAMAISKGMPIVARTAAQNAPKVTMAFIKGFIDAGVWGRFLIGGWLLAKFGGLRAFSAIGRRAGGGMGSGIAETAAETTVTGLPGRLKRHASRLKGIGKATLGLTLASGVLSAFESGDFGTGARGLRNRIQHAFSGLTFGAINDPLETMQKNIAKREAQIARSLQRAEPVIEGVATNFRRLHRSGDRSMDGLERTTRQNMRLIQQSMGVHSAGGQRAVNTSFGQAVKDIRKAMRQGKISTSEGMQAIRRQARIHSDGSRRWIARNFGAAREAIAREMQRGGRITRQGMAEIYRLTVEQLKLYGLNPKEAVKGAFTGKTPKLRPLQELGQQRGGTVPGSGSGDKVPLAIGNRLAAMVEPGEDVFVLNRTASRKRRALMALNRAIPRFAGGGIVALGRELQREGYQVGEHPAFGGVHPVHVPGSYHYKGMAIDVNADGRPGGEARWLDRLYARLKRMPGVIELLWRVAHHFDHLHVAMGPGGGKLGKLGNLAEAPKIPRVQIRGEGMLPAFVMQRALDMVGGGAQGLLDQVASTTAVGGEDFHGGSGNAANMAIGKRMAAAFGWTGAQWAALRELWTRESGWSNTAKNPSSGAFGIPQALPASKMGAAAVRGDPTAQIRWGLGYIKGRYGTPSNALSFHSAHNWYQQGGFIGGDGGSIADVVGLQGGGYVPGFQLKAPGIGATADDLATYIGNLQTFQGLSEEDLETPTGRLSRAVELRTLSTAQQRRRRLIGIRLAKLRHRQGTLRRRLATLRHQLSLVPKGKKGRLVRRDILKKIGALRKRLGAVTGQVGEESQSFTEANLDVAGTEQELYGVEHPPPADTTEKDTTLAELAQAIKDLKDEIKKQNQFAADINRVTAGAATRAFADLLNGQLGGFYNQRRGSAGAGVGVRY